MKFHNKDHDAVHHRHKSVAILEYGDTNEGQQRQRNGNSTQMSRVRQHLVTAPLHDAGIKGNHPNLTRATTESEASHNGVDVVPKYQSRSPLELGLPFLGRVQGQAGRRDRMG
jgi:hypothetical protein